MSLKKTPNGFSEEKLRLYESLRVNASGEDDSVAEALYTEVGGLGNYNYLSLQPIESDIVFAIAEHKYPNTQCMPLSASVESIPTRFSAHGAYAIICSLLAFGRNITVEKDRQFVRDVLNHIPKECFLHKGCQSIGLNKDPMNAYRLRFLRLFDEYAACLDSILELSACMDSDILFAHILSFEESKSVCEANWLVDVMTLHSAEKCLSYFLESNVWQLDFKSMDFRYHFACVGNTLDSKNGIRELCDYRRCVAMLADKTLDAGWRDRLPVGLAREEAIDWMLSVEPCYGIDNLIEYISRVSVTRNVMSKIIGELLNVRYYGMWGLHFVLSKLRDVRLTPSELRKVVDALAKNISTSKVALKGEYFSVYFGFNTLHKALTMSGIFADPEGCEPAELFNSLLEYDGEVKNISLLSYCMFHSMNKNGELSEDVADAWNSNYGEDELLSIVRNLEDIEQSCNKSKNLESEVCAMMSRHFRSALLINHRDNLNSVMETLFDDSELYL